jgi:hypothetical protein
LVSKKLPGIRLLTVELEVGGKTATEGSEAFQQLCPTGLARDGELATVGDMNLDLVAFLELEDFDHGGGKADGKAVTPLGDPHGMATL